MEGENGKPLRRVGGMVGCSFRVVGGRRGCVVLNPSKTYLSSFSSTFSTSRKRQFHCLSASKAEFSDLPRRHHPTRSALSLSNPLNCFPRSSSQFITQPYPTCSSSPSHPLSCRLLHQASVSGALSFRTLRSEGRTARPSHTAKSCPDPHVSALLGGTSDSKSRSHASGSCSFFRTRRSDEGKGKSRKHKLFVGAGTGCAIGVASLVLGLFLPTTRGEEKDLPSRAEDRQQSGPWYHSLQCHGFGSLFSSDSMNSLSSTIPGLYSPAASSLFFKSQSSSSRLLPRSLPSFLPSHRCAEVLPAQCSSRAENDAAAKSLSGSTSPSSESLYQELSADSCLQLFAGTGHPELAREIAAHLNVAVGRAHVGRYADGECVIQVLDEVRGKDVFVIQSAPAAGGDVHSCLMELFLLLTALRRSSAKRITAVIPCMPYDRETELSQGDENILTPMAAADLSVLLQVCGADSVMFVDIHNPRMEGFFTYPSTRPIPMLNVQPHQLAVRYLKKKDLVNPVVVATDNTGGEKAKAMWSLMRKNGIQAGFTSMVCDAPKRQAREGNPILFSPPAAVSEDCSSSVRKDSKTSGSGGEKAEDKSKPNGSVGSWNHVGDVAGRDCIIIDDVIDTGEKAQATAMDLKAGGARRIFMFATHGVLSKGSVDRINNSPIQEVIVTNTVPIPPHVCCEKLVVLSVGKLMAEAIKRVHEERSVSGLFGDQNARLNEQRQFE